MWFFFPVPIYTSTHVNLSSPHSYSSMHTFPILIYTLTWEYFSSPPSYSNVSVLFQSPFIFQHECTFPVPIHTQVYFPVQSPFMLHHECTSPIPICTPTWEYFASLHPVNHTPTWVYFSWAFKLTSFNKVPSWYPGPDSNVDGNSSPCGLEYITCMICSHFTGSVICCDKNSAILLGCL